MDENRRTQLIEFFTPLGVNPVCVERLDEALTHSSYAFEHNLDYNNERLEFLGDALLGFFAAVYLMRRLPEASEGEMSRRKSKMVSRNALGRCADQLGLGRVMRLGRGEEQGGGRHRHSLIGSALEAVIGAIYLADGLEAAERFVHNFIFSLTDMILESEDLTDYKSRFQELAQKRFKCIPQYETVSESGPDHLKTFVVRVSLGDEVIAMGEGRRKKSAENQAARNALKRLLKKMPDIAQP
ncbi:MAG: ribonuclease III [Candidatus Sumerlaeia bacterium]